MKALLATATIVTGALLAGGCATKKYVRNTTAPIQAKVDQVGDQTSQNSKSIQDTKDQVKQVDERAQTGINGANERADAASAKAGEAQTSANNAMTKANEADQKGDQNAQALNSFKDQMRDQIANLDDYKLQSSVALPFKFNKYTLDSDARDQLDKLAQDIQSDKRFFVAVEGFTDKTGSKEYNESLSRKRADSVVEYLVAKHDVPIYRIHMIGLGEQKPVDEAKGREARAKNRRVEVKVFSADAGVQPATTGTNGGSNNNPPSGK